MKRVVSIVFIFVITFVLYSCKGDDDVVMDVYINGTETLDGQTL